MVSVVLNNLEHNGMRRIVIKGDAPIEMTRFERLIPLAAREKVIYTPSVDSMLGIHSLEITYPIHEPFEVAYPSPKKFRRFMFVHFMYASRVSDVIEMAREAFFIGTHFAPRNAYIAKLPRGVEIGTDVHGCMLFEAEFMPANCVAVGGCDV